MAKKLLIAPAELSQLGEGDLVLIPDKVSTFEKVSAALKAIQGQLSALETARAAVAADKVVQEKKLDEYARQAYEVNELERIYTEFVNGTRGYSRIPKKFLPTEDKELITGILDHVPGIIIEAQEARWYKIGMARLQKWLENIEATKLDIAHENAANREAAVVSMRKRAQDLSARLKALVEGGIRVNETHFIVACAEIVPEVKRHFDLGWDGSISLSVQLALEALGLGNGLVELTHTYKFGTVEETGKVTHVTKKAKTTFRIASYDERYQELCDAVHECRKWRADNKKDGKYPSYEEWLDKSGHMLLENAHPMSFDLNLGERKPTPNEAGGDPSVPVDDKVEDNMGEAITAVSGNTLL